MKICTNSRCEGGKIYSSNKSAYSICNTCKGMGTISEDHIVLSTNVRDYD